VDVLTAKTLVSALLVFGIALFSLVSFQHFLAEIVADLRAVRADSTPAHRNGQPYPRER